MIGRHDHPFWGRYRDALALALEVERLTEFAAAITGLSCADVLEEGRRRMAAEGLGPIEAAEAVLEDAAAGRWPL